MAITLRGNADSDFSNGIDIDGTEIELNDDGSAEFASNVTYGDYDSGLNPSSNGLLIAPASSFIGISTTDTGATNKFRIRNANGDAVTMFANGSAEFSGDVTADNGTFTGAQTGANVGTLTVTNSTSNPSAGRVFVGLDTGGNATTRIFADGQFVSMQDGDNSNLTLGLTDEGFFIRCRSGSTTGFNGTERFRVALNGDCSNSNNVYGPFSDIKLKENIVDAKSQWEDLKAVRVVNFNFKEETGFETHKQIGVIAQEIERVSPSLVSDTPDVEEVIVTTTNSDGSETTTSTMRETGTTTKTVATSVLYMKAVKALQEAIERIETLEAEVASLKGGNT